MMEVDKEVAMKVLNILVDRYGIYGVRAMLNEIEAERAERWHKDIKEFNKLVKEIKSNKYIEVI